MIRVQRLQRIGVFDAAIDLQHAINLGQRQHRWRISMHFSPETADRTRLIATLHLENRRAPAWATKALAWPFIRRLAEAGLENTCLAS